MRRHQQLPPGYTELLPASTRAVPLLAKTEPLSEVCSHSVIIYLRKYKKSAVKQQLGEKSEKMSEKWPSRRQSPWKRRGRRCSRHHSRNSSGVHGSTCFSTVCPEGNWSLGQPTQGQVPGRAAAHGGEHLLIQRYCEE